jgi:hypothetical protein
MRTAAICPTCATYENAVCVIYNGPTLSNINVPPLTDLQTALVSINTSIGSVLSLINSIPSNPTLQDITNNGNITDQDIVIANGSGTSSSTLRSNNLELKNITTNRYTYLTHTQLYLYDQNSGGTSTINLPDPDDNATFNFPSVGGTLALTSDIPGYKVYTAVISQTGTNPPTVDYVLNNTLGFNPTFQYDATGSYIINNGVSGWTNNKTVVFLNPGFPNISYIFGWSRIDAADIYLYTTNSTNNAFTNSCLNRASIEIRIYP